MIIILWSPVNALISIFDNLCVICNRINLSFMLTVIGHYFRVRYAEGRTECECECVSAYMGLEASEKNYECQITESNYEL